MTQWLLKVRVAIAAAVALLTPLTLSGVQAQELEHRGAITGILQAEGGMLASSQAGVFFHRAEDLQAIGIEQLSMPGFRVMSMARLRDRSVCVAGGVPGESAGVTRIGEASAEVEVAVAVASIAGQKDIVYGIAVSREADRIAVACADGSVLLLKGTDPLKNAWDRQHKHTATAIAVAFSPGDAFLASCGLDGVVLVSRVEDKTGAPRVLEDHTAGVQCLAFSPDGRFIVSGARDSKVRVHEAGSGRLVRTYAGLSMENEAVAGRVDARVTAVIWCNAGIFAGTSKGAIYRLSTTDDSRKLVGAIANQSPVSALAWIDEGLIAGADSRLTVVEK